MRKKRQKDRIRNNKEAIGMVMGALDKFKKKHDNFEKINEYIVELILKERANHNLRPVTYKKKEFLTIVHSILNKLTLEECLNDTDCANVLLNNLFIPKTNKFLDFMNRWSIPSWTVLVFEILKSIFGF